jgi:hypothetical protein
LEGHAIEDVGHLGAFYGSLVYFFPFGYCTMKNLATLSCITVNADVMLGIIYIPLLSKGLDECFTVG